MSTKKNKQSITVGLFITIGLIILIVGIFTLGGQKKAFVASFTIEAVFNDVAGLQKGDNIWFSGVKIGTVKDISFYGTSQVKVTLHIEKKAREYIRRDSKARVSAEGLIGNKLIVIYGGSQAAPAIEGGEMLKTEEATSSNEIMTTLQQNNKNLMAITDDFKILSKRLVDGKGTLGALLKDDDLFKSLQYTAANLQVAAHNSEKLTSSIADYTNRLQAPGTLASGLVNDTIIMTNLHEAVAQIEQAASSASAFTNSLKNAGSQLENNNNAAGMLLHDAAVAEDVRNILKNLNSGSQKLDENLEALQHNFLLRGYFRRKARQEAKNKTN